MVLLARWFLENHPNARVVIITDRDELDAQIEGVFTEAGEAIYRTSSGRDLMHQLGQAAPRLLCSLVHKFGRRDVDDFEAFITDLEAQPSQTVGEVFVFVDECHRTQSGKLKAVDAKPGMTKTETYEAQAKVLFTREPANMKLLVVVDKLLTGFDAPPCTWLYIDKSMQDHGLFQAICRTNRLYGDDKDFGYIVDYKGLFKKVENAIAVYTAELDHSAGGADPEVLLKDRLKKGRERLDDALEALVLLCEPVELPKCGLEHIHYFCANTEAASDLQEREPQRTALYKIEADEPRTIWPFDNLGLLELIVKTGIADAIAAQLGCLNGNKHAVAATIENNVRRKIIKEQLTDPAFYAKMSAQLQEIIELRKARAIEYEQYLQRIAELAKRVAAGQPPDTPAALDTPGRRAVYKNLKPCGPGPIADPAVAEDPEAYVASGGAALAFSLKSDQVVRAVRPDGWRGARRVNW